MDKALYQFNSFLRGGIAKLWQRFVSSVCNGSREESSSPLLQNQEGTAGADRKKSI
jgi:hypothetical protein